MGQYFKAVNLDKHEVVCPWCIGGGAKLWEWAANPAGSVFTLLLRKSDERGGGDCVRAIFEESQRAIAGRWAGDRIVMIGDYDSSDLWFDAREFSNISKPLVREWNKFIELPDYRLHYRKCGCHRLET